jgi:hypothetical protein
MPPAGIRSPDARSLGGSPFGEQRNNQDDCEEPQHIRIARSDIAPVIARHRASDDGWTEPANPVGVAPSMKSDRRMVGRGFEAGESHFQSRAQSVGRLPMPCLQCLYRPSERRGIPLTPSGVGVVRAAIVWSQFEMST